MDSNIFLRIKDKEIDRQFQLERAKDINRIATVAVILRTISIIFAIISHAAKLRTFSSIYWVVRSLAIAWQFIVLIAGYKWPLKVGKYHSALLMPNSLLILAGGTKNLNLSQLGASIQGPQFFVILCILISNSWIPTAISMTLTILAQLFMQIFYQNFCDLIYIWSQISILALAIYASYHYEKRLKLQFLHLNQIQVMNSELNQIFNSLPEGIIVYNKDKEQITLSNNEIKRIYSASEDTDIQENINKKNLHLFDIEKQCLAMESQNCILENAVSLFEAGSQSYENQKCYQIFVKESIGDQDAQSPASDQENIEIKSEIVAIKQVEITFQGCRHFLIVLKNMTSHVNYERLKIQNHFYEILTATVSHDLRTPLNSIIGLLGNMDHFIMSGPGKKYLQILMSSSQFMLFLVNDLLDYFQIKNGKFKKNEREVNINQSLTNLIDMFNIGAREKGIQLNYFSEQGFPEKVITDEQRVKQITLNLLQNSLKFTMQGSITVLSFYDQLTSTLKVSVKDTGVGIKFEDREKLFQTFGKLDDTKNINTTGIGLGLNICKKMVEAFNGEIYLEESNSNGSKFTFTIQCQSEQSQMKIIPSQTNTDINTHTNTKYIKETQNYQQQTISQGILSNEIFLDISVTSTHLNFMNTETKPNDLKIKHIINMESCTCEKDQILIVDDNIFNIVTLQTILEYEFGFSAEKALNGLEAYLMTKKRILSCVERNCKCKSKGSFKIIFMDCNMPVMDGFQATKEIRQLEEQYGIERTCIVALTAYSTDMFAKKCQQSGMDNFITKPVNKNELEKILSQVNL